VEGTVLRRPLLRSAILVPSAAAALAFAFAAMHLRVPAAQVARECVGIGGALLLVNLFAWVARDGARFGREERLWAFMVLGSVVVGYFLSQQAIAEREFDYIVQKQQHELADSAAELSREIIAYIEGRWRTAPPRPRSPDTWEHDESTWALFERETVAGYEQQFSRRVRETRAGLTFRNLRDRDLDMLYQRPGNSFQIRVIGERLGVLAERLRRAIGPSD
jgi:hypothetical protein